MKYLLALLLTLLPLAANAGFPQFSAGVGVSSFGYVDDDEEVDSVGILSNLRLAYMHNKHIGVEGRVGLGSRGATSDTQINDLEASYTRSIQNYASLMGVFKLPLDDQDLGTRNMAIKLGVTQLEVERKRSFTEDSTSTLDLSDQTQTNQGTGAAFALAWDFLVGEHLAIDFELGLLYFDANSTIGGVGAGVWYVF